MNITASGSSVKLVNNAHLAQIMWMVGSSEH